VRLTNLLHGVSEQPTCQRSKQWVQHSVHRQVGHRSLLAMIISGGSDNSLPITGLAIGGLLVIGLGLFGSGANARLASARRINDQANLA